LFYLKQINKKLKEISTRLLSVRTSLKGIQVKFVHEDHRVKVKVKVTGAKNVKKHSYYRNVNFDRS